MFFLFKILALCSAVAVASATSLDHCNVQSNIDYWKTGGGFFEFREQLSTCGFRMFVNGPPDPVAFGTDCLIGEGMPYNEDCIGCFAALAQCAIDLCQTECLVDQTSALCENCNELNCNQPYYDCAGTVLDVSGCSDCVKPGKGEIIPGIPNNVFFAVVGVGVAGFAIGVYWVFLCKREEEWDEYADEAVIDDEMEVHKKKAVGVMNSGIRNPGLSRQRSTSLDDGFGTNVFGAAPPSAGFVEVLEPIHAGEDVPLDEV
mmetsp:Transcript_21646/g.27680  ORF Transcript_21646/g.27680 Transcript_21646/m.27680 type:complete len:259 (-) Transcript_21646:328-1104(-)